MYNPWKGVIEHVLTRHQAGTLDVDFKNRIVDHMVNDGLKFKQDVNWGEVDNLLEFRGTTGYFLEREYHCMVVGSTKENIKENHPDLSH